MQPRWIEIGCTPGLRGGELQDPNVGPVDIVEVKCGIQMQVPHSLAQNVESSSATPTGASRQQEE